MADERNFENARDLYRKAREAKSYGGWSVGGGEGTITETFGHREPGLPKTFTHVNHPLNGWTTFVGQDTDEIKAAQHSAISATHTLSNMNKRPETPEPTDNSPHAKNWK